MFAGSFINDAITLDEGINNRKRPRGEEEEEMAKVPKTIYYARCEVAAADLLRRDLLLLPPPPRVRFPAAGFFFFISTLSPIFARVAALRIRGRNFDVQQRTNQWSRHRRNSSSAHAETTGSAVLPEMHALRASVVSRFLPLRHVHQRWGGDHYFVARRSRGATGKLSRRLYSM